MPDRDGIPKCQNLIKRRIIKPMKKILFASVAALLVLAGCGPSTPGSSSTSGQSGSDSNSSSSSSSSEEVTYVESVDIVDYVTGASINELNISTTQGGDVKAVVTPTGAEQDVTWSIADESIATINAATGAVTGVAVGTTTLTVTTVGLTSAGVAATDTIDIIVNEFTLLDIGDFKSTAQDGQVYAFAGILEDLDHADQYGNCFITDPLTGDTVEIYGSTTTESALTVSESGTGSFKNPKDAKTTLASYNNGEWVTGYGVWTAQYNNLSVIFTGHEAASEYTYEASVSATEGYTVTLSKTSGLAYGETVTVTVATNLTNSYNVIIQTAYGVEVATASSTAGTYTFSATCENVVTVESTVWDTLAIDKWATEAEDGKVYSFAGILEGLSHSDQYGNAYITDPTTGASLKLYGSTTTSSAITSNGDGTYSFSNPRDAKTTLESYSNGEWVEGYAVWNSSYSNASAVLTSHEASSQTYTATLNAVSNGTATLSKTSGIAYGETITVTITPDSGYIVSSVALTTAYGSGTTTRVDDTTYTFAATCVNTVTVTLQEQTDGQDVINLTENIGSFVDSSGQAMGSKYGSYSAEINGYSFDLSSGRASKCTSGTPWASDMVVMRANNEADPVESYMTIEAPAAVASVSVTYQNWNKDYSSIAVEHSTDGTTWTADATGTYNITSGESMQTYETTSTGVSTTHWRIVVDCRSTYSDGQARVGIDSVTFILAD